MSRWVPWALFALWLGVTALVYFEARGRRVQPVDFLAYRLAAESLQRGGSPYAPVEEARSVWLRFHHDEQAILAADRAGGGKALADELGKRPQLAGPYLYPPTLALLVHDLGVGPGAFAALVALSVLVFAWLWLRWTGASPWWLLLILGSIEIMAATVAANAELVLLLATLAAARLLWDRKPLAAAPLLALVILVKPFYALFFVAFVLLQRPALPALRAAAIAAGAALVVVALEALRWGPALGAEAFAYLSRATEYLWLALPPAEQSPMSIWNRTPVQALIMAGVGPGTAQLPALGSWAALLGISRWRARRVVPGFPEAFAVALALLYWGRPVGWGLNYLDLVLASVLWPRLGRTQRAVLMAAIAALALTRWIAVALTAGGHGLQLLTLQSAAIPWETWLVLPAGWLLATAALTRPRAVV